MKDLKRLVSGLLCSVLVLGLVNNHGVLNSYAEENIVTSDSLESDNQIEQSSEFSVSTADEEANDKTEESTITGSTNSKDIEEESPSSFEDKLGKSNLPENSLEREETFPIDDCTYIDNHDGSITLTGYTGTKTDLVIPSKIVFNGQTVSVKVRIDGNMSNTGLFPTTMRSITFMSVEGTKVGFDSTTGGSLDYLFSTIGAVYPYLTSIDFSGLDMDNVTSMKATFYGRFVPNLKTIKFGENTLPNVTNMENTFNQLANLETIEQQWVFGKLTSMAQMFGMNTNDSKLISIGNTSTWNTSTVTNMSELFLNCWKLTNLDLSNWDVSNVTNMKKMFFNCRALITIGNTKDWNVSKVTDFSDMFYNCISLNQIRMDNWKLNPDAYLGGADDSMFLLWNITEPFAALIVASDEQLLDFPYNYAGYKPSCGIRINANTGNVAKNEYYDYDGNPTGISYYFDKVVIPTAIYEELESLSDSQLQSKIRNWLEDNIPTKTDYALTGWAPTDPTFEQKIQSMTNFDAFMTSQAEFKAEWVSDKFDTSPDNSKLNPTGSLGLAYYPTSFTINSADLQSSGEQKIPISKQVSLNLGVKDRTRTQSEWHVTAQLIWNNNQLPNAYITAANTGTVTQNISTGLNGYSPSTDLTPLTENGITGTNLYKINGNASPIMESNGTMINNGVYDFSLGEAVLVIPDVSQIATGIYKGRVEWNLVNGPS